MVGKDGDQRNAAEASTPMRKAGDEPIALPCGPGVHGFSGIRGKAPAFDPESLGDGQVGLMSGRIAVAEAHVAPELARHDDEQNVLRLHSDPAIARTPAPKTGSEFLVIVHRAPAEVPNLSRLDSEADAQAFIEELIGRGVEQGAIETFRASKLDFVVSFKPVVSF